METLTALVLLTVSALLDNANALVLRDPTLTLTAVTLHALVDHPAPALLVNASAVEDRRTVPAARPATQRANALQANASVLVISMIALALVANANKRRVPLAVCE